MGPVTPVVVARVVFSLLALTTASTVLYTCLTDGTPFRWEILTPWMGATLVDFYVNVAVLATWVWYKEETWIGKLLWIASLICLGSIFTCVYVVVQLFKISATDPLYLILLRERHAKYAHQHGLGTIAEADAAAAADPQWQSLSFKRWIE